jgi:uncharacterized Zn finger protein
MGLLGCASGNSLWCGDYYHKENKISNLTLIGDGIYQASVLGSSKEAYQVTRDILRPKRSNCNCPHADGKRLICKHITN